MSDTRKYQVRVKLVPPYAEMIRSNADNVDLAALHRLLSHHSARLKCQFDAFADYVAEAEHEGTEHYPLYR